MDDCAARSPKRITWVIGKLFPMRSAKPSWFCCFFLSRETSPVSTPNLRAFWIETLMRSGLVGFTRKSLAPARMASTAESIPPFAVRTMTGSS